MSHVKRLRIRHFASFCSLGYWSLRSCRYAQSDLLHSWSPRRFVSRRALSQGIYTILIQPVHRVVYTLTLLVLWITFRVQYTVVDSIEFLVFLHLAPDFIQPCLLLLLVYEAKVEMLELAQTVLEKDALCFDELLPRILATLELNRGRLVLQASHLVCLHHCLILVPR